VNNHVETITVNGKRFVAGLYWQSLQRPRAYLQEAREIGRRERMDVVAIRRGRVLQAGFATRAVVGNGSAYSFAAALAGALGDDWIAVFELDAATYAIAAAKNGAIIPGCDAVGTRSEIEESLRSNYNLHQFGRVICPGDFDFGGEELQLSEILQASKLRKEYRLSALSAGIRKDLVLGAFVLLVVVAGVVGFGLYKQHQKKQARLAAAVAAAAEQQRLAELEKATGTKVAPIALTHPWATQPLATEFRDACLVAIHALPLSLGGWMVESASCTGTAVQATYKREPVATVNGFRTKAQELGYQVANIDDSGEQASVVLPIAAVKPGGDDTLMDMALVVDAVRSVLQSRQASYTLNSKQMAPTPAPTLPGQEAPPPPPAPDWKTSTLTVSGKQSPADLLAGIERLPALRLLTIAVKRSDSELEWSLTGEINGK